MSKLRFSVLIGLSFASTLVGFAGILVVNAAPATGPVICHPAGPPQWEARVQRVVDGDTVDLQVELGFDTIRLVRARLFGIDAPEVTGPTRPAGLAATEWTRTQLSGCGNRVWVQPHGKDKYGRSLLDLECGGRDLADRMVEAGQARRATY